MISIIKLSSSETVITDVLSYDEETNNVNVLNPLQLSFTEDLDTHKMQMFSSAWIPLFGENTEIEIAEAHIIAITEATEDMVNYYYDSIDEMKIKEGSGNRQMTDEMRGHVINEILKVANTSIH